MNYQDGCFNNAIGEQNYIDFAIVSDDDRIYMRYLPISIVRDLGKAMGRKFVDEFGEEKYMYCLCFCNIFEN